jgi:hypothetical protein
MSPAEIASSSLTESSHVAKSPLVATVILFTPVDGGGTVPRPQAR